MDIFRWFSQLFGVSHIPSPSDIVPDSQISYDEQTGELKIDLKKLNIPLANIPKAWWPGLPPPPGSAESMDPVFDRGNNNLLIQGADAADHKLILDFIKVGDIVVYRIPSDYSQTSVFYAIHRIVKIGMDDSRYFIFKGDNNAINDPYKARDSNVLWLSIGVIY